MTSGIGVLDKTVQILDAVAASPQTLRSLTEATGIARPTAHRLARGMERHGLLRRDSDGRYRLGLALVALGHAAQRSMSIVEPARPILAMLCADTGESVQLYVREGDRRVCVVAVEAAAELRTIVPEGAVLPLNKGSAGRVLTGDIGPAGWTETVSERAQGVASVSAPVRGQDDSIVAAISISGPIDRMSEEPGRRFGAAAVHAADALSAGLGRRGA